MITRRRILAAAAASACPLPSAFAQLNGLARIMVGFPPGGSADVIARSLSKPLTGGYASNLIVENKAGAGGRIALEHVKAAAPDGLTMLLTPESVLTLYPHVYKDLRYDPFQSLTPVCAVSSTQLAMYAGPGVPANISSIPDLVKWLRANPKLSSFGSPALGSAPHLAGLLLAKLADVEILPVAYQGAAPAMMALLSGEIPLAFGSISDGIEHFRAGKTRLIATTGAKRSTHVPNAPTFAELGFPDLVIESWHSILLPAKSSPAVVTRLNEEIKKAVATPDVQKTLSRYALEPVASTPEEFAKILQVGHERWGRIVKSLKFTIK